MRIWVKWWSKSSLWAPVITIPVSRSPSTPFWCESISEFVALHFIIELIWIHSFSFFFFTNVFVINCIFCSLIPHYLEVFIFKIAWKESSNHFLICWMRFNLERCIILELDFSFLISNIIPVLPPWIFPIGWWSTLWLSFICTIWTITCISCLSICFLFFFLLFFFLLFFVILNIRGH